MIYTEIKCEDCDEIWDENDIDKEKEVCPSCGSENLDFYEVEE